MRKLIRIALVASVLYGAGLHWTILQSGAWAGMIATSLSESSWVEAVSSTFSGQKPCHVCKVVEKGSNPDQSSLPLRSGLSVELAVSVVSWMDVVLTASAPSVDPSTPVSCLSSRPLVPPPKVRLA